jgi:hypothetical protein
MQNIKDAFVTFVNMSEEKILTFAICALIFDFSPEAI